MARHGSRSALTLTLTSALVLTLNPTLALNPSPDPDPNPDPHPNQVKDGETIELKRVLRASEYARMV
jgi:hypothetical protein